MKVRRRQSPRRQARLAHRTRLQNRHACDGARRNRPAAARSAKSTKWVIARIARDQTSAGCGGKKFAQKEILTMQLVNTDTRYGVLPQALHWATVICVVAGWLLGQFIDDFRKGSHAILRSPLTSRWRISRVARRAPSLAFCQSPAGAVADPFRPGRRLPHVRSLRALCAAPGGADCRHCRAAQARQRAAHLRRLASRRPGRPIAPPRIA